MTVDAAPKSACELVPRVSVANARWPVLRRLWQRVLELEPHPARAGPSVRGTRRSLIAKLVITVNHTLGRVRLDASIRGTLDHPGPAARVRRRRRAALIITRPSWRRRRR